MTLVHNVDNQWQAWRGDATVEQTVATCTVVRNYHDGRCETAEEACEPYSIQITLNGSKVTQLYNEGIWSLVEVESVGARVPVPFVVPKGKQAVGQPRYEQGTKGSVKEVFDVEDIPEPRPEAEPIVEESVLTPIEKLAIIGLTVDDLKELLKDQKAG